MRRGQAELINSIGRVIIIVILLLILSIEVGFFTGQNIQNRELEATIIEQRVLASLAPDPAVKGVIDPGRVDDLHLHNALFESALSGPGDSNRWGVQLKLYTRRADLEQDSPLRTAKFNNDALNFIPLAKAGVKGGAEYWNLSLPVIIEEEPAWLFIEVVRRE